MSDSFAESLRLARLERAKAFKSTKQTSNPALVPSPQTETPPKPPCPPSIDPSVWSSLPASIRDELLQSLHPSPSPPSPPSSPLPPLPPTTPPKKRHFPSLSVDVRASSHSFLSIPYIKDLKDEGRLIIRPPITRERALGGGEGGATKKPKLPTNSSGSTSSTAIDLSLSPPTPSSKPFTLPIHTQNLWFDSAHQSPRMSHLLNNHFLTSSSPIILIQELTGSLLPHLTTPSTIIHTQQLSNSPNSGVGLDLTYGCGVLFNPSSPTYKTNFCGTYLFRNSAMARGLTFVSVSPVDSSDVKVLICSTHLESWTGPGSTGAEERKMQIKEVENFAKGMVGNGVVNAVVVAGDMNWDDEKSVKSKRKMTDLEPLMDVFQDDCFVDAYRSLHPTSPGFTYDAKTNPMLSGGLQRRFDRVIIYSPEDGGLKADVEEVGITGEGEIIKGLKRKNRAGKETEVAPSDHYGLRCTIRFSSQK